MKLNKAVSYAIDFTFLALFYRSVNSGWTATLIPEFFQKEWIGILSVSQILIFLFLALLLFNNFTELKPGIKKLNEKTRWYFSLLIFPLCFFNFFFTFIYEAINLANQKEIPQFSLISFLLLTIAGCFSLSFIIGTHTKLNTEYHAGIKHLIFKIISKVPILYSFIFAFSAALAPLYTLYGTVRLFNFIEPEKKINLEPATKFALVALMHFLLGFITLNILNIEFQVDAGHAFIYRILYIFAFVYLPLKASIWLADPDFKKTWPEVVWPFIYLLAQLGIIWSI